MNITNISSAGTVMTCPHCGNRFSARIEQIIDVGRDPSAKMRFLSGQTHTLQCPNCQNAITVGAPVAYHDPAKQLLMIHVPMELNLSHDEQERVVGQLTRAITDSLPMEQRRAYLLNPRRAFTLQGMIEAILAEDGVTKDMLNARRAKVDLLQKILTAPDDLREAVITQNDAHLDEEFFQILSLMIETALAQGNQMEAQQIAMIREDLLARSSYGRTLMEAVHAQEAILQEVAKDLQKNGQNLTRASLLDLAITYATQEDHLKVLVGMMRQAMDYEFLQLLAERIEQSKSKSKRQELRDLRDRILEYSEVVDQQRRAQVQQAATIIQQIINAEDMVQAVQQYLPYIDEMTIAVIQANISAAQEKGQTELSERLRTLYQIIQSTMSHAIPPELQFINDILSAENETEARLLLLDRIGEFGPNLLDYIDALIEDLSARGAQDLVEQLLWLRDEAERAI